MICILLLFIVVHFSCKYYLFIMYEIVIYTSVNRFIFWRVWRLLSELKARTVIALARKKIFLIIRNRFHMLKVWNVLHIGEKVAIFYPQPRKKRTNFKFVSVIYFNKKKHLCIWEIWKYMYTISAFPQALSTRSNILAIQCLNMQHIF